MNIRRQAGAPNDGGNAPFRVPASVTQTAATELRILLFNVSGASTVTGMNKAQKKGIKRVLNSEELALDKFSTFIFCSDMVTNPKKRVFNGILQTSSPTSNENAAIFYTKMAESRFCPKYVCDVHTLPAYLKQRQRKQQAKRHIETLAKRLTTGSGRNQTAGTQEEPFSLEDAQ